MAQYVLKLCMKNSKIKYMQYCIQIVPLYSSLVSFLNVKQIPVQHRNWSLVIMLNPMINNPKMDMPQDATFQNQSKMQMKYWKNIDGCILYNKGSDSSSLTNDWIHRVCLIFSPRPLTIIIIRLMTWSYCSHGECSGASTPLSL